MRLLSALLICATMAAPAEAAPRWQSMTIMPANREVLVVLRDGSITMGRSVDEPGLPTSKRTGLVYVRCGYLSRDEIAYWIELPPIPKHMPKPGLPQ